MLSTAVYPALDWRAAAWSPPIIGGLLRGKLGFSGVTITDSLDSAAAVRHQSVAGAALRSAQAGSDLLLITGSEADSRNVFASLRSAAMSGALPMSQLMASYNRIVSLKSHL
jgi:beta-N-acetylhexosaminidase